MRRAGPLLLLAILLILGGLGASYYARLKLQGLSAPAKPKKHRAKAPPKKKS